MACRHHQFGCRIVPRLRGRLRLAHAAGLLCVCLLLILPCSLSEASRASHSPSRENHDMQELLRDQRVWAEQMSKTWSRRLLGSDRKVEPSLLPVPLDPQAFKPGSARGKWHWVITSCDRHHWGRMISHALLTGMANDLQLASTTILWCRSLGQQIALGRPLPSLLFNLRASPKIHVFVMSEALATLPAGHTAKLLFSMLGVSTVLCDPSLPVVVTEDDVAWAPFAGTRLTQAIASLPDPNLPFCLSLYNPSREGGRIQMGEVRNISSLTDNDLTNDASQTVTDKGTPVGALAGGAVSAAEPAHVFGFKDWVPWLRWKMGLWKGPPPNTRHRLGRYWYGAQGMAFSANMVTKLMPMFADVLQGREKEKEGLQDVLLDTFLDDEWRCTRGEGCYFFSVKPSLLQHIGTHSALFAMGPDKTGSTRFHVSEDFPVRLRFPGFESTDLW